MEDSSTNIKSEIAHAMATPQNVSTKNNEEGRNPADRQTHLDDVPPTTRQQRQALLTQEEIELRQDQEEQLQLGAY